MKGLRKHVFLVFIIFSIITAVVFYIWMTSFFEERLNDQQNQHMLSELNALTAVVEQTADEVTLQHMDNYIPLKELTNSPNFRDERLTIVDLDGDVVFDSDKEPEQIENQRHRPEVAGVLDGAEVGSHKRKSPISGQMTYYMATPLLNDIGELIGVIRLSEHLPSVYLLTTISLIGTLIVLLLFAATIYLIIHRWTIKIQSGLKAIESVVDDLKENNFDRRYRLDSYEEINHLGRSVNDLSETITRQVHEKEVNEEQIQELINNLVLGVMLLDEDQRIIMTNPAMNEILGTNFYGQLKRDYNEVIKSSDIVTLVEQAYSRGKTVNDEITIYYPDERIIDVNVVPIPSKTSSDLNVIILLYDITEIRRLEKVRTDFVANASHELRTPITALKGFSETLLDGAMEDQEVLTEFLQIINKEAERLDTIVEDILQLSRLEQKVSQVNAQSVRLKDSVEDVFQILQQKAEIKNIHCGLVEAEPTYVFADPDHVKQIVMNLIANAIAYTREDGSVCVRIGVEGEEVYLQVEDNGIGIPEADIPRIFERFYRVDRARSRNAGGTGLGLSIVRWLVDSMNARIEVDSEYKKGSIFSVYFPKSRKDEN